MIKLITFDLWNTLISENGVDLTGYRVNRVLPIFEEHSIKNINEPMLRDAFADSWKMFMYEWETRHYTPTTASMLMVAFEKLGIKPSDMLFERVLQEMETILLDAPVGLIEGTESILNDLKMNYRLALISDTGFTPGKYLRQLLKKLGIFNLFNVMAFSDEIGVSKPDRRMFDYVLKECRIEPNEAIHIGDLLRTDIAGASNAGMRSVHFRKEIFIKEEPGTAVPSFVADNAEDIPELVNSI